MVTLSLGEYKIKGERHEKPCHSKLIFETVDRGGDASCTIYKFVATKVVNWHDGCMA